MRKKERAVLAVQALANIYPEAVCSLVYNKDKPYELLIATRLSAQCTDARVNIVTKGLFERYQSLKEFADAKLSDIEKIVHSCGFYKVKSKDIIEMSRQLLDEHNGELPNSIEELTKLSGIGRKTANLIMGDIFHQPAIITDTHCIRICGRLGLTTGTTNPKKVEDELWKILNPEDASNFCHRLVHFGRDTCAARSPKCGECKLHDICKNPQDK
ncbi:MAG: endonuclease III [Oscillospiraceae bacterium]